MSHRQPSQPPLDFMDNSLYLAARTSDSPQIRSHSDTHTCSTATDLEAFHIHSLPSTHDQRQEPSAALSYSDHYLLEQSPEPFVFAPVPQQLTAFPAFADEALDTDWSAFTTTEIRAATTPQLRLDPAPPTSQDLYQRPIRSYSNPTNMSTLGIQQFDQRFESSLHAGLRHTYTWPQFELNEHLFPQQSSSSISPAQLTSSLFEEPKLMHSSSYAKSLSSSPPRSSFTPEQRELKRQRDHARRDSKTMLRRERSSSNNSSPYVVSPMASPDLLPRSLPDFTDSLTPSPLLSHGSLQSSPALGGSGFLSPFPGQASEPIPSDMYGPVFTMNPQEFTSAPHYSLPYTSSPANTSLHSFVGRPHSHSLSSIPDQPSLYRTHQLSPKIGSSESGDPVRVVHSRPKPQCWEHGCNGRPFSTFSNLLRHQREKSGAAQKSSCPNCGAEFTRTTARNGHMAHDKCKQRRNS